MTSVGAVIVTWNSGAIVERACAALLGGERAPDRLVVVDNASTDPESLASLARLPRVVERLDAGRNLGFCGANNLGVAALGEVDHVLLCNPDAIVTPSFLAGALEHLERHPEVGALGPRLVQLDLATGLPSGRVDSVGIRQTPWGQFVDRGQGQPDDGRHGSAPFPTTAVCAAAAVYRRVALESAALPDGSVFDEGFFMYKEDIDLSLRLRRAGWAVVVDPRLVVHHGRGLGRGGRRAAAAWIRRRSLANEWRVWRRGTLGPARRASMLPYLLAKTLVVAAGR